MSAKGSPVKLDRLMTLDALMTRTLDRKADHLHASFGLTRACAGRRFSDEVVLPLALEVGKIGIFESDLEHRRTRFSPELCKLLGLPIGTAMSYEDASRLIHEDDRARVQSEAGKAAAASHLGRWVVECRVRRVDGEIRWVAISGWRMYRQTKAELKPVRSIGTVIDITPLKKTEDALRDSEQRLRLALEAARMGTFETDIAATEARIDAQLARLLGLAEDTRVVPVEMLRERVPHADLRASDAKKRRMEKGEAYHHEFRLQMPDGSARWLSTFADIRSNRIFGVSFDITRRKLSDEALRRSESRFRTATNAAALGVFEWDPVADEVSWGNPRIYKIFGRLPAEGALSRRQFETDHLHPGDRPAFNTALEKAIRTQGGLRVTCRIKRSRGGLRRIAIEAMYEKATNETPAKFVGVIADITRRTNMERRVRRLAQRLLTIQEEERRSIAQELHDSTVQHLVAASLSLMPVSQHRDRNLQTAAIAAETSLQEAIRELRTFSYLMHPPILHQQNLYTTLVTYIGDFAERSGLLCKLRMDRKHAKYATSVRRTVLRIVQEGLANAYRHAAASRASIDIRRLDDRLHVVIADDGRGPIRELSRCRRPSRPGVGIRGIRMRLAQVCGKLRVSGPAKGGTRMHAVVPTMKDP
jgi:PAS domain S-box-containing protein